MGFLPTHAAIEDRLGVLLDPPTTKPQTAKSHPVGVVLARVGGMVKKPTMAFGQANNDSAKIGGLMSKFGSKR